jgi:hypothetical protein
MPTSLFPMMEIADVTMCAHLSISPVTETADVVICANLFIPGARNC